MLPASDKSTESELSRTPQGRLLKASSFEVDRDRAGSGSESQGVSGYLSADEDSTTFEGLDELCLKGNIEKVMILYRNYTFVLVDVSFADMNSYLPKTKLRGKRQYTFKARNVHLDTISA